MGLLPSTAAFLSQASLNPGPYGTSQEQAPAWGANADDHVDTYFECITAQQAAPTESSPSPQEGGPASTGLRAETLTGDH